MLLPSQLRPCSLFPNPFPWLLPSYLAGSLCHLHFLLVSITVGGRRSCSWSGGMASCSKLLVGPGTATVRLAASLRPASSSSSPSSIHRRGRVRPRAIERAPHPRCCCYLCTRADSPRLSCILRAVSGARRGGQQVAKSRVALRRSFTIAVEKRACVKLSVRSYLSMCG